MEQLRVHVRWMIRRDIPEVLEIERVSFCDPWSEEEFLNELSRRKTIGMVAEHEERIVAYMVYELHKLKLQLLNLAVAHNARRRGVGRLMLEKLALKLSSHRRARIETLVRESNLPAQLFFRECGYRASGIEHDPDWDEPAYRMILRLPGRERDYLELCDMMGA